MPPKPETYTVTISGVPIEVTKKNVKRLSIRVHSDARVTVSAPRRVSDSRIRAYLETKIDWIQKQRGRFAASRRPTLCDCVSGEVMYVWGEPYTLRVEYGTAGLALEDGEAILTAPEDSTAESRREIADKWYRAQLAAEIEKRLPQWETRTGLHCAAWQIRNMTSRWGSCTTNTGRIRFSLRLAERPTQCLDYVLLHELAHLKVPNHGPEFKALLDSYMPDWREITKTLNYGA